MFRFILSSLATAFTLAVLLAQSTAAGAPPNSMNHNDTLVRI
jgi:hypothetical protein